MTALRFWSDDFDMDLVAVIPGVDAAIGNAADIRLWTYGGTSLGRLNHPAVWDAAFFGTDDSGQWKPNWYSTDQPLVECTWREVLRDAWPHTYLAVVDGQPLWDTHRLRRRFERLMYHLRGLRPMPEREADELRGQVLGSVIAATRDLRLLLAAKEVSFSALKGRACRKAARPDGDG